MGPEQTYCRSPLAKAVNDHPDLCWHGVTNAGNGLYDSGMPDAFVSHADRSWHDETDNPEVNQLMGLLSCFTTSYRRYKEKSFTMVKKIVAIECKAAFGSVYLGNPEDEDDHEGWHASQRNWWNTIAVPEGIDYRIALWVYSERNPTGRIMQNKARLFLVPPPAWIALETASGEKTISLTADLERIHAKKIHNIETAFGPYETTLKDVANKLCQI